MAVVSAERAMDGYLLGKDEGEAHWLLGMLEIVKISGADTGGAYGLLEVTVRAGEGSPWHVHPDEDEWFYVLEGSSPSTSATGGCRFRPARSPSAPRACRTPSSPRPMGQRH